MGSEQKRAFLAVILSGIVLFTWQAFFAPSQRIEVKNKNIVESPKVGEKKYKESLTLTEDPKKVESNDIEIKEFIVKNRDYAVRLNSRLEILEFKSKDSVFLFRDIAGEKVPFKINFGEGDNDISSHVVNFENQYSPNELRGTSNDNRIKIYLNLSDDGKLNFNIASKRPLKYQLAFATSKKQLENGQIRSFMYLTKDVETFEVGDDALESGNIRWAGIDYNFHLFAFVLDKAFPSGIKGTANGDLLIDITGPLNELNGSLIFTKKSYDKLVTLGSNLNLAVNFGIWGVLAVPILRGLQFFYKYIPNYGIAIILLTLIIRLITFPLQWKSFKSMKKMQKIQPEINKIKEKFKDNPQKMQQETMALFKKAGANPLGGCLPLVLQMPIFFAFYKVLYAAVELVGAPFVGWISDLSVKDPYFVLPVLMTVMMFLQQKLNPSASTDPTQQKVLMFMPIIFGFIMKDLPSGLVLYICVSTIFGITQQLFVYRTVD